jgi:site-specific DNA recombinase
MRVGLYPRVSGHEQEDNYSIPEQIDRMKKYCESKHWMVHKIYTDSVYSGSNMDRPGLQEMIRDCENGKLDMVLVYKLDRLSRSQKDTMFLIEDVFEKNGVGFTSMTENFDTSTPHGKFIVGILAVFSQLERSRITERTMSGKDGRAKEGKWHGGKWIPIGYDYDGLLFPNEYEAMQVKEIAGLFLKGTPVRTIERMMKEKGYKHKHGEWDAKTIRRVLSNPVNIGMIKHRDTWYKGIHDPILDQKTFDAIQKLMEKRREEYGTARPHQSLLGGILYCKNCGARYARQSYNGVFYYICYSRSKKMKAMIKDPTCKNKNYRYEVLDAAVLGEIKKLTVDPAHIENLRQNRPVSDTTEKVKAITQEIAKIDSQISKMMDLYALGTIDLDVISSKVGELNDTKLSLTKELEGLNVQQIRTMTDEEIVNIASMMDDDLPLEDKRSIVQSLIHHIEIDEENIIIHWKF